LKYYSQLGQDIIASDFFEKYPVAQRTFIDVGAFDGLHYSNTHLFYKNGWAGLCVEACSKNYLKLNALYANTKIVTVHCACADYDGEAELNIATIPGSEEWGSDVSSLGSEVLSEWENYAWEKEIVEVKKLNTILITEGINDFNYLSIDVEGFEMAVLKGLDLKKYHPELIISEYHDVRERKTITKHLGKFGYILLFDNLQDVFYIKAKFKHFPFFLKYKFRWISRLAKRAFIKISDGQE